MINLDKVKEFDKAEDLREYMLTELKAGTERLDGLVEATQMILKEDREVDDVLKLLSVPMGLNAMELTSEDMAFVITAAVVQIIALKAQQK